MEAYLKENGVLESSSKIYANYYNKLLINVFENTEPENMLSSDALDKVIEYAKNDKFTLNTKGSYLKAWRKIATVKKHEGDTKRLTREIYKLSNTVTYTPANKKEKDNRIEIDEIVGMREEYKGKLKDTFSTYDMYYLMCSLYTYIPPLRSEDYYSSVIKTETTNTEKENYYDIETKKLVINKHKTVKSIGKRIVDIPDVLAEIIKDFHDKSKSPYLICTRTGKQLISTTFQKSIKRCLKHSVSSSMMRKIYISSKIDTGMSAIERQENARIMGHSVNTQQALYSKFSDVLHPDRKDLKYLSRRHKQLSEQLEDVLKSIRDF